MEKLLNRVMQFLEENFLPLIAGIAFLIWWKHNSNEQKEAAEEKAQAEHNDRLMTPTKKALPKDPKKKPAVARQNEKAADAHLVATVAEEIKKHTGFGFSFTRKEGLNKVAAQMKKYQCSISKVANEYRIITGSDMYKDVKIIMGDDYQSWLKTASTVK